MPNKWTDYYYEILDFYYWEPQHLGKQKNINSKYNTYAKVFHHLEEMEVSLNHIMSLFFHIIPQKILNNILNELVGKNLNDNFTLDSENIYNVIGKLNDFTQPDFIFEGEKHIIAIELKIKAKSSPEQLMKYYLLNAIIQKKLKTQKEFIIFFLGSDTFSGYWEGGYRDVNELKIALSKYIIPDKTFKGDIDIIPFKNDIRDKLERCDLFCRNFNNLATVLKKERAKLKNTDNDKGWEKIIGSVILELKNRKLLK